MFSSKQNKNLSSSASACFLRYFGTKFRLGLFAAVCFLLIIFVNMHRIHSLRDASQTSSYVKSMAEQIDSKTAEVGGWKFPQRSKPKKILITYGEHCCKLAKKRACDHALKNGGFDVCIPYNMSFMSTDFVVAHQDILQNRRGAGYWLWKPYIIFHTLLNDKLMQDGDILGTFF
ncbi:hypothetical protein RFI_33647 [Reticulomyxa filosa]|uniref:Uncharacterized protein n=1 Tax=Reticulomyxa filosa TaxID=46433 RepID=X6LSM3_RETFI|nr:hypothetical protein RFI_33647 [Reticulomyxa filosa]|eukprot:ETO03755.1 hypothetical protein RFI_33647 [Reticulomyxa filosa]